MDKVKYLRDLMKGFNPAQQVFFSAKVEKIEGNTCSVQVADLSISNVRLKPTTLETGGDLLLTPKIGATVLVGSISGDLSNLEVLCADELSEFFVKIGDISIRMNEDAIAIEGKSGMKYTINDKVTVVNSDYSLKDAFYDIIAAISKLTVTTGVGPSGIPINKKEFDTIKDNINKLLS